MSMSWIRVFRITLCFELRNSWLRWSSRPRDIHDFTWTGKGKFDSVQWNGISLSGIEFNEPNVKVETRQSVCVDVLYCIGRQVA